MFIKQYVVLVDIFMHVQTASISIHNVICPLVCVLGVCEHLADIYNSHSKIKYDKTIDGDERVKHFAKFFDEYVPAKLQLVRKVCSLVHLLEVMSPLLYLHP